jgi:hypothetical protein
VSALFLCAALLAIVQTPAQRGARAPAAQATRDTIFVAVQSPPPAIIVEAPSQWPAAVLGILGLLLVGFQVRIMRRQTDILDRQTAIAAQQAEWRVGEAVGTFVRLAHDLVAEFRKANVPPMMTIEANFDTHPRQMLREASRFFAPLGGAFLVAANLAAMRLDDYFLAVEAYNDSRSSRADRGRYQTVQTLRTQVGGDLDLANSAIPQGSRWTYSDGRDYDFRSLCSLPKAFLESDGWIA